MNPIKRLSRETRLSIAIAIAGCFFIVEISIGIYTRSLALIADAFHVAFDVLSFAIALGAAVLEKKENTDQSLSFGWQRATLLGSFFNGVFQIALGFSISLLSIERFIELEHVNNPKFVFYVACAGLASNLISGLFLGVHEHSHGEADDVQLDLELLKPHQDLGHRHKIESEKQSWWTKKMKIMSHGHDHGHEDAHGKSAGNEAEHGHSHHDLGMQAVLIHVLGDAFNNFGVAGAALIMWLLPQNNNNRFYADPAMSLVIGIVLVAMAVGLVKRSGRILLGSVPIGISVQDVKHDLENVDGVISVHELHIWRLTEAKSYASAHIVMADPSIENYEKIANTMLECFHAYGVHSATIQPEFASPTTPIRLGDHPGSETAPSPGPSVREASGCRVNCGTVCEERSCCG